MEPLTAEQNPAVSSDRTAGSSAAAGSETELQYVFARKEIKYLLSDRQYQELLRQLSGIVCVDQYGKTSIQNIYFDTPDFLLVRESLEKPRYKEKLRLRSYGHPTDDTTVFLEIKKKFDGIVYKRRAGAPYRQAVSYLRGEGKAPEQSQIMSEIDYFLHYYHAIGPAMRIQYDRIAMIGIVDPELRMTFDTEIQWSMDMDLERTVQGVEILAPGQHLMELKISDAIEPRISRMLSSLGIFPVSKSKYGLGFLDYARRCAAEGKDFRRDQTD